MTKLPISVLDRPVRCPAPARCYRRHLTACAAASTSAYCSSSHRSSSWHSSRTETRTRSSTRWSSAAPRSNRTGPGPCGGSAAHCTCRAWSRRGPCQCGWRWSLWSGGCWPRLGASAAACSASPLGSRACWRRQWTRRRANRTCGGHQRAAQMGNCYLKKINYQINY